MSGNKNSFFSAIFLGSTNRIFAYNFTGGMYVWERQNSNSQFESKEIVHGHFNIVTDISWDSSEGNFLLSCSKDQTTRAYAADSTNKTWHEIGRPQVHGYDLNSISLLKSSSLKGSKMVSASEEKIIRLFEPPYNLVKFLNSISNLNIQYSTEKPNEEYEKSIVLGNKQQLGLMTRTAVIDDAEDTYDVSNFDPTSMLTNKNYDNAVLSYNKYNSPPDEDFIVNYTLWPETNKLYGHSYEVYTIKASHKGDLFASANVSKNEKYSQLYIWSPESNTVLQKLEGHKLTIAQIVFSYDDSMILTVSRGK